MNCINEIVTLRYGQRWDLHGQQKIFPWNNAIL